MARKAWWRWRAADLPIMLPLRACVPVIVAALLLAACAPSGGAGGSERAGAASGAGGGVSGGAGAVPPASGSSAAGAATPAPTKFVIGLASLSPQNANIQTAHDAGIFLQHGLESELQYTGGGANSIAPLVSGQIPVMIGGIPAFAIAQLGGADLRIIAVQNTRFDYFFVATPDIQRPEDLRGKTVSGTRRGALADTALDYLLRYWGFEPFKDVHIAHVNGGESVRAAAIVNGAAVGTVMIAPLPQEFAPPRYNVLANMSDLDIAFASNGLAAPTSLLAQQPDLYERFLRAYLQGNHYFRTQPEAGARGVLNLMKRDDLEYGLAAQAYYAKLMAEVPTAPPEAMQAMIDALIEQHPAAATTRPADLLDLRPLDRIIASGYLDQMKRQ